MQESENTHTLDPSAWILSYVDFMTVIMAFFIVFVMIATKVASATELFIVKKIESIYNALNKTLVDSDIKIENVGYNGVRIIIPSVVDGKSMFNSGSSDLSEVFKPYLSRLGGIISDSTEFFSAYYGFKDKFKNKFNDPKDLKIRIRIEGHTDSDGSAGSNMILSLKRAEGIKKYFVNNNIFNEITFAICGYGEKRPLNDIKNKLENRRVEIFLNYIMDPIFTYYGCVEPTAYNYDPKANRDDGSCINNNFN